MITGALVIVLAACLRFFAFQTMMVSEINGLVRRAPWIKMTPHSLPDTSLAAGGPTVDYLGLQFDLPWSDLKPELTKVTDHRVVFMFDSGRSLMVTRVPPDEYTDGHLFPIKRREDAMLVFGEDAMKSDYAFVRQMLEARPSDVTLFSRRSALVRTTTLLTLKALAVREPSGNFYVRSREMPGFQYGDPQARPHYVAAHLFASDAGTEFVFFQSQNGPGISQGEINRVVQTLKRVDNAGGKQAANIKPAD